MLHLELQEKQEQAKSNASRRRGIIKTRAKINEIETKKKKKTYQESMKQKAGSLKKKNKIDNFLPNLTKMRRKKDPN
jgi:hypothetical protein